MNLRQTTKGEMVQQSLNLNKKILNNLLKESKLVCNDK